MQVVNSQAGCYQGLIANKIPPRNRRDFCNYAFVAASDIRLWRAKFGYAKLNWLAPAKLPAAVGVDAHIDPKGRI
jgi:hypothetical protein